MLRLLLEVVVVIVVAYTIYVAVTGLRPGGRRPGLPAGPRTLPPGGRWRPHHYAEDGQTVVVVARMTPAGEVLEEHVVARIPDADPDWSPKFLTAKQEAEERAFHLNAES